MTEQPTTGHNGPPDPIDEATAPYAAAIGEAENWLDGQAVTDEAQMKAVDDILKQIRSCGTDLKAAQTSATAPLNDAWKAEIARWKPTVADVERIKKGLAALVSDFKVKLAAEKEAERRAAWEAADRARREAEEAVAKANPANIEEARAAEGAIIEAKKAEIAAHTAQKDTVKGLRTFTVAEVQDYAACINWIRVNDRAALMAFCDEYARTHHAERINGVDVRKEKRAY